MIGARATKHLSPENLEILARDVESALNESSRTADRATLVAHAFTRLDLSPMERFKEVVRLLGAEDALSQAMGSLVAAWTKCGVAAATKAVRLHLLDAPALGAPVAPTFPREVTKPELWPEPPAPSNGIHLKVTARKSSWRPGTAAPPPPPPPPPVLGPAGKANDPPPDAWRAAESGDHLVPYMRVGRQRGMANMRFLGQRRNVCPWPASAATRAALHAYLVSALGPRLARVRARDFSTTAAFKEAVKRAAGEVAREVHAIPASQRPWVPSGGPGGRDGGAIDGRGGGSRERPGERDGPPERAPPERSPPPPRAPRDRPPAPGGSRGSEARARASRASAASGSTVGRSEASSSSTESDWGGSETGLPETGGPLPSDDASSDTEAAARGPRTGEKRSRAAAGLDVATPALLCATAKSLSAREGLEGPGDGGGGAIVCPVRLRLPKDCRVRVGEGGCRPSKGLRERQFRLTTGSSTGTRAHHSAGARLFFAWASAVLSPLSGRAGERAAPAIQVGRRREAVIAHYPQARAPLTARLAEAEDQYDRLLPTQRVNAFFQRVWSDVVRIADAGPPPPAAPPSPPAARPTPPALRLADLRSRLARLKATYAAVTGAGQPEGEGGGREAVSEGPRDPRAPIDGEALCGGPEGSDGVPSTVVPDCFSTDTSGGAAASARPRGQGLSDCEAEVTGGREGAAAGSRARGGGTSPTGRPGAPAARQLDAVGWFVSQTVLLVPPERVPEFLSAVASHRLLSAAPDPPPPRRFADLVDRLLPLVTPTPAALSQLGAAVRAVEEACVFGA